MPQGSRSTSCSPGLTGPAGGVYPTHLVSYTSARTDYRLGSEGELAVT